MIDGNDCLEIMFVVTPDLIHMHCINVNTYLVIHVQLCCRCHLITA